MPGDDPDEQQALVAAHCDGQDGKGAAEWLLPASFSTANCHLRGRSQQPCRHQHQPVSVLRSWLATSDCSLVLTGKLWKERTCTGGATRVWIEVDSRSLFEAKLSAGVTAVLPGLEAVVRFGHSLYIGARGVDSPRGQQEQDRDEMGCHEVGGDVHVALKPRPGALW
jgi:hypothetical protein